MESQEPLLSHEASTPEDLKVASVLDLCNLIGHIKDIWLHNPQEVLRLLRPIEADNPLRGILLPPQVSPTSKTAIQPQRTEKQGISYKVGDHVQARVPKEAFYGCQEPSLDASELNHLDQRKFFPAAVLEVVDDISVKVQWARDIGVPRQCIMNVNDLMHEGDVTGTKDGVDLVLQQKSFGKIGTSHVCTFILASVILIASPQAYIAFFTKPDKYPIMEKGFATVLGAIGFAVALLGYMGCGKAYALASAVSKGKAKRIRSVMLTAGVDNIFSTMMPGVRGECSIAVGILYTALICIIMELLLCLQDSSVLTFGLVVAAKFAMGMNILVGEKAGLNEIRMQHFLEHLQGVAKDANVDIKDTDIQKELRDFIDMPYGTCVHQLSLQFAILIGLAFHVKPDTFESARTSMFIIKKGYRLMTEVGGIHPMVTSEKDIVVDVFDETINVPGANLHVDHWSAQGAKVPWHLALHAECVTDTECLLRRYGVLLGSACFAWWTYASHWADREASNNVHAAVQVAKAVACERHRLNKALTTLLCAVGKEEVEHVAALLQAGAGSGAVELNAYLSHACKAGNLRLARLLIEAGASAVADTSKKAPLGRYRQDNCGRVAGYIELAQLAHEQQQRKSLQLLEELDRLLGDEEMPAQILTMGQVVQAKETFQSISQPSKTIRMGSIGKIEKIEEDGNAMVYFQDIERPQWVHKPELGKLAALQGRIALSPEEIVRCPKHHDMERIARSRYATCNFCFASIDSGEARFKCNMCDVDMCLTCQRAQGPVDITKLNNAKTKLRRTLAGLVARVAAHACGLGGAQR